MKKTLALILVLLVLVYAAYRIHHHLRAREAAAQAAASQTHPADPTPAVIAADPVGQVSLVKSPALLLFDASDPIVVPAENELAVEKALGAACLVDSVSGGTHADPRLYAPGPIVAFLKSHVPPGTPVVLIHAYTSFGSDWTAARNPPRDQLDPMRPAITAQIKAAGYPVLTSDFGGPNNWGNDAAVADMERLVGPKKVAVVAESMGGALMWRWAEKHPSQAIALVGIAPVCSLKALCASSIGSDVVKAYN